MRLFVIPILLISAVSSLAAEEPIQASGRIEGAKVKFPAKSLDLGARATLVFLESCHDASDDSIKYTEDDLKKALAGNHIRLEFAVPRKATVLDEELQIKELIFTFPIGRGVFWLRGVSAKGETIHRATKFEFDKQKHFEEWLREAQAAE